MASKLQTIKPEEIKPEFFLKAIVGIQEDIEILLDQNGVTSYREPESKFVPQRQQAIKTVPTIDESLNNSIQERIRPGFEQGTEVVRKERVVVSVYKPAEVPDETSRNDQ